MNYFLSLELPLWWFFLPLVIAGLCAYKYYKAQSNIKSIATYYRLELSKMQDRLNECMSANNPNLVRLVEMHKEVAERDSNIIRMLNTDKVEREGLIELLNSEIAQLTDTLSFKDSIIQTDEATVKGLRGEIEQLHKQAGELSISNHDYQTLRGRASVLTLINDDLKADLTAAISVINRTGRAKAQWSKVVAAKQAFESNKTSCEIEVVHDSQRVPTITQADQSEDFNARHIQDLGSEVVRGIEQQNAAIKKELEGMDMSQLDAGDRVRFRGGSFGTIKNIEHTKPEHKLDNQTIKIWFIDNPFGFYYNEGGSYETGVRHSKDIIQIIKQPKNN